MRNLTRSERIDITAKRIAVKLTTVYVTLMVAHPELAHPQNKANVLQALQESAFSVMPDAAKEDAGFVEAASRGCTRAYNAAVQEFNRPWSDARRNYEQAGN